MLPSSSCLLLWNSWPFLSVVGAACLLGILFAISFRLMRERDKLLRSAVTNTDRKFAEDALRQTQTFLDTVIEHAPSLIVVRDAQDYHYLLLNKAAEELFGITREKIIGKTAYEILPVGAAKIASRGRRIHADRGL